MLSWACQETAQLSQNGYNPSDCSVRKDASGLD